MISVHDTFVKLRMCACYHTCLLFLIIAVLVNEVATVNSIIFLLDELYIQMLELLHLIGYFMISVLINVNSLQQLHTTATL